MNNRIWKYPFRTTDVFELEMPMDAKILSVQMQQGVPCIWAQVNAENSTETRRFKVYGTGNPLPEHMGTYIGTYQEFNGGLIWHLYEVIK